MSLFSTKNYYRKKSLNTKKFYKQIIVQDLILKSNYKNIMEIPKLNKIVINTSSKVIIKDKKYLIPYLTALEIITSQKFKIIGAKKSIATFKVRENQLIGSKVTIRKERLYLFFEKLIRIILPRIRDYKGLKKESFDIQGNYSFGINNFLLFPELENFFEYFDFLSGLDITINISTKNLKEARLFLSCFQIPARIY